MASFTNLLLATFGASFAEATMLPPAHKLLSLAAEHKAVDDIDGPWEAVEQAVDGDQRNICAVGRQLPDFYVIGQQKCGTSSIAQDMMEAGVGNVHGPNNDKEFHFFDAASRLDFSLTGAEGVETNRASWREWMPDCPDTIESEPRRKVLADFTPSYLALVPFPEDMQTTGPWLNAYEVHANAPQKMRELYGEEASGKLQFAVMMREPLSQMQSAWYHAQSFDFSNVCSSCRADSFRDALQSVVGGLGESPPSFTQWVWNVMYGRHLEEWLRHFKASQFYIVPTNVYSKGNNTAICGDLSSRLGFQMTCSSLSGEDETTHAWTHEHPSLSDDTDGLRMPFEDLLMAAENDRLVNVLVAASRDGMGLANYEGERGDKEAIKKWLEAGW